MGDDAAPYSSHAHSSHAKWPDRDGPARGWRPGTFLGSLARGTRAELLSRGERRAYPPGSALLNQGDRTFSVYLLLQGAVKIITVSPEGDTALLAIRSAGDIVGEMAALEGRPRSATL